MKSFSYCTLLSGVVDNVGFKQRYLWNSNKNLKLDKIFKDAGADLSRTACTDHPSQRRDKETERKCQFKKCLPGK